MRRAPFAGSAGPSPSPITRTRPAPIRPWSARWPRRRWTGSWHTVFLAIDPAGDSAFDAALEADLRAWLEPLRLAGHDLEFEAPDYVPLDVRLVVCVTPGHLAADVERALLRAFSAGSLPDGGRGFFHPDNYTFGTPVRLSRIIAHAMAIPGVQWVGTALPGIEERGALPPAVGPQRRLRRRGRDPDRPAPGGPARTTIRTRRSAAGST